MRDPRDVRSRMAELAARGQPRRRAGARATMNQGGVHARARPNIRSARRDEGTRTTRDRTDEREQRTERRHHRRCPIPTSKAAALHHRQPPSASEKGGRRDRAETAPSNDSQRTRVPQAASAPTLHQDTPPTHRNRLVAQEPQRSVVHLGAYRVSLVHHKWR